MRYLLLGMMLLCALRPARDGPHVLKQTIEQRLGVQVYLVDETPMPGLYLLGTAQGLLYSDARGDYVLQGSMLDLAHDMRNLTRLSQQQQRRLALSQIGRPGSGSRPPLNATASPCLPISPAVLAASRWRSCPACRRGA